MIACCTAGALVPNIIEGIKKNGWLNNYNDENPKKTMSQDSPLPKEQKGPIMAWSKCEVEIIDREQSPQTV